MSLQSSRINVLGELEERQYSKIQDLQIFRIDKKYNNHQIQEAQLLPKRMNMNKSTSVKPSRQRTSLKEAQKNKQMKQE